MFRILARILLAANAPRKIPDWFSPMLTPEQKEYLGKDDYLMKKERIAQWPWFYADLVLARMKL